jgi:CRISPR-associated protein Csb2
MTLVLEIEYLTGVAFAAQSPDSDSPDWPPQPDRIFSALVASWGATGERNREDAALEWLEKQPPPLIAASRAVSRTPALHFVPPNDPKTGRSGNKEIMPALRRRQPRWFQASRPCDPTVRLYWAGAAPDPEVFAALSRLAANTAYVGHSSSLTRCHFLHSETSPPAEAQLSRRRIYEGRFNDLCENYKRFVESGGKTGRPRPGDIVTSSFKVEGRPIQTCFSSHWLVLEHIQGEMPDIRAAALVTGEIRNTVLSGYRQNGMADRIPAVVSGHTFDGHPTSEPHLAIVPLAFAGFPYADGHMLGFALVPPRGSHLLEDAAFLQALRKVAPLESKEGRRTLRWSGEKETIRLRRFGLRLSPTSESIKKSLAPDLYTRKARTFATVTPIVLDRHLKGKGAEREDEVLTQIKSACRNIGLPEPVAVVPNKHSAIEGAPSAEPSGRAPAWMRWRTPASLASRPLTHAVIQFSDPIDGPVILGAGRFVGLGLCRPIESAEGIA